MVRVTVDRLPSREASASVFAAPDAGREALPVWKGGSASVRSTGPRRPPAGRPSRPGYRPGSDAARPASRRRPRDGLPPAEHDGRSDLRRVAAAVPIRRGWAGRPDAVSCRRYWPGSACLRPRPVSAARSPAGHSARAGWACSIFIRRPRSIGVPISTRSASERLIVRSSSRICLSP